MQALSQSSFLQALGYAIANSLWQVALLWLIAIIINASLKLSSHNRYRIAISAQLAGFVWFIVTLQFYYKQCMQATVNAQLLLENNTVIYQADMVSNKYNLLSYISKAEMLLPYLSLAYLCLLCLLALRWLKSYRFTSRLKLEGLQKADMDVRLFVQDMAAQLGIKHKVKVYLSTLVNCPLTIGFIKPIILVPVATVNHLTTEQLEAVLLHELAHIRRADYLINLLLNIIETILFFNPFTRLISQTIHKEREHCCDDWVLQFKYNAPMYAEALLRIACLQSSPAIAMKAEGKNKGELLWRVKRLLNHKQKRFNYSQQMIALVVTTCMLISIAWLQPEKGSKQPQQTAANTKPVKAVVVAPMAVQVNNPFFSPLAFFAKPLNDEVKKATQEIVKADLSKTINSSIDEAGKALTAVAPTVLNGLDKLAVDSNFEQATNNAKQALKKIKWDELKNLSPFVDSAYINNAVSMALNKSNLAESLQKAKESLEASKLQIAKLKQANLDALLNQDYMNAVIDNANSWINKNDFGKIWNDNTAPKKEVESEKENRKAQQILLQNLWKNRVAPRVQSFTLQLPKRNECYQQRNGQPAEANNGDELANWSYTNPVYVERVSDDATNDEDQKDSIYSYTSQPQTPVLPAAPSAKTPVHVVEVTNPAQGVSIVITISE